MTDSRQIRNNFSRHAGHYEKYAAVQKFCADKLIEFTLEHISAKKITKIADLGCGTGLLTRKLLKIFPAAEIDAIDISPEMIIQAKQLAQNESINPEKINWICSDAEKFTSKSKYDLIISNACFQWLGQLDSAIARCKNMLTTRGILAFSAFGPQTYCELNQCLKKLPDSEQTSSASFVTGEKLQQILSTHFDYAHYHHCVKSCEYDSLLEFLTAIKYTGTRGTGLAGKQLTRSQIKELQDIYIRESGSITATNELIFLLGK